MSLYETINHGAHAYFDASVTLLFFLLIGRTLDHVMRDRARAAVIGLARLAPRGALVVDADGTRDYRPVEEIEPGMRVLVAAGERIPVDGARARRPLRSRPLASSPARAARDDRRRRRWSRPARST